MLRLLQIKSCSLDQIIDIIRVSENKTVEEIEKLRKNQLVLMSPQRKDDKLVKMYEILPEGIQTIDKTETEGFAKVQFGETKEVKEISKMIDDIIDEVQNLEIIETKKENIINQIIKLKNKLEN